MSDFAITLEDVTFVDLEIPESINFGGVQRTGKHQLPGGTRIIDSMTRDDDDIEWSGLFLGPGATDKARYIDTYRQTGQQVTFSYYELQYTVVVKEFKPKLERYYQVSYSIKLEIVQDLAAPPQLPPQQSVDDLVNADNTSALGEATDIGMTVTSSLPSPVASSVGITITTNGVYPPNPPGPGLNLTNLASNLTNVQNDLTNMNGIVQGASAASIAQLSTDISSATTETASLISQSEPILSVSSPGGVVFGAVDPEAFIAYSATAQQVASIVPMQAYLTRMGINVSIGGQL